MPVTARGMKEVAVLLCAGLVLGVVVFYAWAWTSRPTYTFGRPEAHYLAESDSINILVPYHYHGGCELIQWAHKAFRLDQIYTLAIYEGPPRFTETGPGVYANTVALPDPLEAGDYQWRGEMVCTDALGKQTQYVTDFVLLRVPDGKGRAGPHRMNWKDGKAIPQCCGNRVL